MVDIGSNDNIILVQRSAFDENQRVVDKHFARVGLVVVLPGLLDRLGVLLAYDVQDRCSCLGDFDNLLRLVSNTTTTTSLAGCPNNCEGLDIYALDRMGMVLTYFQHYCCHSRRGFEMWDSRRLADGVWNWWSGIDGKVCRFISFRCVRFEYGRSVV